MPLVLLGTLDEADSDGGDDSSVGGEFDVTSRGSVPFDVSVDGAVIDTAASIAFLCSVVSS